MLFFIGAILIGIIGAAIYGYIKSSFPRH